MPSLVRIVFPIVIDTRDWGANWDGALQDCDCHAFDPRVKTAADADAQTIVRGRDAIRLAVL
jgi:hypothetical protein